MKVRRRQKVALACSLCLTFVIIALTIVRASRLRHWSGVPDPTWAAYWCFIPALMGLILTSATALRALFVSRAAAVGGGGGGGGAGAGVAAGRPADEKPFVRGADKFSKKLVVGGGGGGVPRSAH
jgi:hypothetical protein